MPNDMPVYDTLTSAETRLVQVMRRYLFEDDGAAPLEPPAFSRVEPPLHRFIDLLWRTDPYAVDLNHRFDFEVSVFELQVLYAIAEERAGHARTVNELMAWWFPDDLIPEGRASLATAARILEEEHVPRQSTARLREHLLAVSSARVRRSYGFVIDPETSQRSPRQPHNETVH